MPSEHSANLRKFNPWALSVVDEVVERKCTCCLDEWPLDSEFWFKDGKNKEGFSTQCKACLQEKEARKKLSAKPVEQPVVVKVTFTRKICTRCNTEWPQDSVHFRKDSTRDDGLSSQCKACLKAKDKLCLATKRAKREAARSMVHPDTRMRSFTV